LTINLHLYILYASEGVDLFNNKMEIIMNTAILTAVAQFTNLKADKNYKLSALVKLCEDYAFTLRFRYTNLCEGDFYDFLFSFSQAELANISSGKLTYNDL